VVTTPNPLVLRAASDGYAQWLQHCFRKAWCVCATGGVTCAARLRMFAYDSSS
jgi:hypothetical protein